LPKDWIIAGKVVSGAGEGAYFTRINWVQEQCQSRLGFKPYPGTLNLEISNEYLPVIESLNRQEGIALISPDPRFCNAKAFPISLGKISGALIMPDEKVRIHAKNIIEIIAPLKIKASLSLSDGDFISVAISRCSTKTIDGE
jgi:CTP-dependent riboflavin kinase